VKDAADYLTYIKALMVVNPQVLRWTVVREKVQGGDMGMLRYRLTLRGSARHTLTTFMMALRQMCDLMDQSTLKRCWLLLQRKQWAESHLTGTLHISLGVQYKQSSSI